MPIRTNRGRAAVYRRLWGWPFRSPKHLAGVLIVLAVVVVTAGIVLPNVLGSNNPSNNAQPQPNFGTTPVPGSSEVNLTAVPSATTSLPTRLTGPQETPTSAAPSTDGLTVAKEWATAWVNHPGGITSQQWLDGLRPFTTDEFLPRMSTVDPRNIEASKVTGNPVVVTSYTSSLKVTIPTDGPKLSITVSQTPNGWRVSDYGQAS
ncbi:MAG: hypothetical protein JWQ81_6861 [Amycolatopsis sp.]|uniref:hypothetical protein n=1 Tax=Amycolatopsis sp. TaxID=37632 RepID=UPI0026098889|nr:hypothetical protein [Amycolatopsis sp.]MCU1686122.1 hypothetical protein [Amycolatopsis sp.]